MTREEKQKKLDEIAAQVAKCTRCRLHQQATKGVPGDGDPESEVIFIGEGPGYHEDQQGLPFVGVAGRLLDRLLQLIKLKRSEVWIGNVIKHRPPGNRDPLPEEIEACRPFLDEQIKIIDPKIIVSLGRFSMSKFLPGEKISQVHGQARYVNFAGKKRIIIPMYHPAAALRRGAIMEQIKKDFLKIPQFLSPHLKEEILPEPEPVPEKPQEEQMGLF